ncbi:hypothetical protein GCM10020367_63040 [Streptomyces sannanensis]|uniref:Xylose isomerase-like TIM barrel domain-containing protein n=2 Tax=Streptomyces sannanensis TaxID=285536 RepID=A0ABP6SM15_9ACTN
MEVSRISSDTDVLRPASGKPPASPLMGVSTSALADRAALDELLPYQPDVVEFYNYPSSMIGTIARFCSRHGIRPALHTPVPYDLEEPLRRFAPTGPDPAEAEAALLMALQTIRTAADLGAIHVVVHFPSPYPPYPVRGFAQRCADFLTALDDTAREHGVPVLVENLSTHPLLHTPKQYERALDGRPGLGLCLDLGHAHLGGEGCTPLRFGQVLGRTVRSMHVYNTTAERYATHGHEAAVPEQSGDDGYLDLAGVLPELVTLAEPAVVVLEHRPITGGPTAQERTADWVRELISSTPERGTS